MAQRGRKAGSIGKGNCPRCGATPCHQKYRPRTSGMSNAERADRFYLVDAVACPSCKMAFRVSKLEYEEPFIIDWDTEYEYVPNYCPQCGERIHGDVPNVCR